MLLSNAAGRAGQLGSQPCYIGCLGIHRDKRLFHSMGQLKQPPKTGFRCTIRPCELPCSTLVVEQRICVLSECFLNVTASLD